MTTIRASRSSLWPAPILGPNRTRSGALPHAEPLNGRGHAGRAALRFCAERGKRLVEALADAPSLSRHSHGTRSNPNGSQALPRSEVAGTSLANPHKIIWIRLDDIVFKTCCDHDL